MSATKTEKGPRCPLCGKPTTDKFKPFCSGRCADVDLARWFTGGYRIPGPPARAEEPEEEG